MSRGITNDHRISYEGFSSIVFVSKLMAFHSAVMCTHDYDTDKFLQTNTHTHTHTVRTYMYTMMIYSISADTKQ
jgi:hypothetical protein